MVYDITLACVVRRCTWVFISIKSKYFWMNRILKQYKFYSIHRFFDRQLKRTLFTCFVNSLFAGQDRTGQDKTGQDRTGQDKTGQDRTDQDRTGQDRTGRLVWSINRLVSSGANSNVVQLNNINPRLDKAGRPTNIYKVSRVVFHKFGHPVQTWDIDLSS